MSDDHDDLFGDLENLDADSPVKPIEHIQSEEKPKTSKRNREDDDDGDEEGENDAKKICLESENKEIDLFKYDSKQQERIKMQVLVSNFSEEQLNRYELFRRATFTKASIRRLMNSVTSAVINQNVLIAMSGIAKVFVGEMVESALDVKEQWEETGPIQPKHLREAHRRMRSKNMYPSTKIKKSFLM